VPSEHDEDNEEVDDEGASSLRRTKLDDISWEDKDLQPKIHRFDSSNIESFRFPLRFNFTL
jgi:hypothetical protein